MILDINGKQVVVSRDRRTPTTWLQICAYGASLGIELSPDQAMEIGLALFQMGRKAKSVARSAETRNRPSPQG